MKGSKTLATGQTDASGNYMFKIKIKKKTTVKTVFAGTVACGASASKKATIGIK